MGLVKSIYVMNTDSILQEILERFPETRTFIEARLAYFNLSGDRGDVFLRVPGGDFEKATTFYQASVVHVIGKYFPHFHNLTEGYSRKVPKGMRPLAQLSDWDKNTLLQASNYIPHNTNGKDLVIRICSKDELIEFLDSRKEALLKKLEEHLPFD